MDIVWTPKKQQVSDLKLWDHNPRQISKQAYQWLKERITKRGFHDVVKVDTDNVILSGNQRRRALEELGVTEVWTMIPDRPLKEEERNAVALESNMNDGDWDWDSMANFDLDFLKEIGFDDKELAKGLNLQLDVQEDEAPEPRPDPNVKIGDLFQLGNHRLLCGDATKKEDVERLMDGQKADMVFTDPPYGVSYADKNAFLNSISPGNRIQTPIEHDHDTVPDMKVLWDGFLLSTAEATTDKASYYVCAPQGGELMMMMMAIDQSPWMLKHTMIWVKNNHVLGRSDYNYKHEPILYGWKKDGTHNFVGMGPQKTSVWEVNKPLSSRLHPTMKPIELIANAILNSTIDDQAVFDPFGGSGSTLIACEQLNRKCYMMEIDPQYVRVIIDRWEKLTGRKAEKIG